MSAYRISQEQGEWAVSRRKTGEILVTFSRKDLAEGYVSAQMRADEQSEVMAAFNARQQIRSLMGELRAELAYLRSA